MEIKQISDDIKQFSYEICQRHNKHTSYPKFKSKHDNHKSYTTNFTNGNITVDFKERKVKLPKLKEVKAKLHRNFSGQIKSATVSQVPSGKYFVSVLVETEHMELPHTNQNTGIDLGVKDLCITPEGKKYENPKTIRKYIKIDTFYASSQLCDVCGYKNTETRDLSVREWICPVCGAKHDRDINAAKNILAEGIRQIA